MNRRGFIKIGAGVALGTFFGLPPVPGGDNRRMVSILRRIGFDDIRVLLHKRFDEVVAGDVFKIEGEEELGWFAFVKQLSSPSAPFKTLMVESLRDKCKQNLIASSLEDYELNAKLAKSLQAVAKEENVAIITAQQIL